MRFFLTLLIILNSFAQSQDQKDKLISCQLSDNHKTFDLRKLQTTKDYNYENLYWNFCGFTLWPADQLITNAKTFAYILDSNSFATPLTDSTLVPEQVEAKVSMDGV